MKKICCLAFFLILTNSVFAKSEIIDACRHNDIDAIKRLVSLDVDLNVKDENGDTPFLIACNQGNIKIADLLLKARKGMFKLVPAIDVNTQDRNGKTAFMKACENENIEVIRFLTADDFYSKYIQVCNVLLRDYEGHDAFMLLCMNNKTSLTVDNMLVADRLLVTNEDIKNARDKHNNTPLMLAVKNGNVEAVDYLMSRDVSYEVSDSEGQNIFMLACKYGMFKYAQTLLSECGIDINSRDAKGNNALLTAADDGDETCIKFLISHGADLTCGDSNGQTAFMKLCEKHLFNLADDLIAKGVDINAVDLDGKTALIQAAEKNDKETLDYLLKKTQLDSTIADKTGNFAFKYLCQALNLKWSEKEEEIIRTVISSDNLILYKLMMLNQKINLFVENSKETPLVLACGAGSFELVSYFVEQNLYSESIRAAYITAKKSGKETILAVVEPLYRADLQRKLRFVVIVVSCVIIVLSILCLIILQKTKIKRRNAKLRKERELGQAQLKIKSEKQHFKDDLLMIEKQLNKGIELNSLDVKSILDKHITVFMDYKKYITIAEIEDIKKSIEILKKNQRINESLKELLSQEMEKLSGIFIKKEKKMALESPKVNRLAIEEPANE